MKAGPGDHIESRCTRCHDITGHVVIALVDGEIAKVVCQACGSVHRYYSPVKKREPKDIKIAWGTQEKSKSVSGGSGRVGSKQKRMAEEAFGQWQEAMNAHIGTPTAYGMDVKVVVGDLIEHPSFGRGVVQGVVYPDKAQILFREGVKLLKCSLG